MNARLCWLLASAWVGSSSMSIVAAAQAEPTLDSATGPAVTATCVVVSVAASDGLVTLNADDTLITQILNAFSRQTGRSIVVGPDVTGRTTVRLTGVPWESALEAVLKPFGYGHYNAGNATVVCGTDVLVSRLFTLKYMDAGDVEDLVRTVMSPRGKFSKVVARGQSWSAAAEGGGTSLAGGTTMGKRQRSVENKDLTKTKSILVTDISVALDQVAMLLEKVDRVPSQILIEARFMEVSPRVLRDVGVEFGSSVGVSQGGVAYGIQGQQLNGDVAPGNFSAFSGPSMNATYPFNAGLNLAFQRLTDPQFQVLLHLLQENASVNVLSAPRILTLNNQEASIIVGTKYPIIDANVSGSGGVGTATITTSLRGYEDIGIQLNVLPQICDGNFISMVVRPSVREQIGTKSGKSVSGGETALTEYPVISTREAETQVIVRDGQTIVIGGLLKDKQTKSTIKVPVLGDIPLFGALFRRQTDQNEKIDLLIFLTASIIPAEGSSLINTNLVGHPGVPVTAAAATVAIPTADTPTAASAKPSDSVVVSAEHATPGVLVAPVAPVPTVEAVADAPVVIAATETLSVAAPVPAAEESDPEIEIVGLPEPVPVTVAPSTAPTAPVPTVEAVADAPAATVVSETPPVVAPVPAAATNSAGNGVGGDEVSQAVERARAASVAAADKASATRQEFGIRGESGVPTAGAP